MRDGEPVGKRASRCEKERKRGRVRRRVTGNKSIEMTVRQEDEETEI